jgi:hypothetical protein
MNLITRPFLDDQYVKQIVDNQLTMSGTTDFVGTLKSKGVIINASAASASAGYVLTYNGSQIVLLPQSGGTARGNALVDTIVETAHGFGFLDVIGHDGTGYVKVTANDGQPEAIGLVSKVIDANTFEITYQGVITGLSGATITGTGSAIVANTTYYVSAAVAGKLTDIEPTEIGQITKPMLVSLTTNKGLVFNWRAAYIVSGTTANGGGGGTSGTLGIPTDGTYSDGLLTFTASTKTADAVDDINEVLLLLAPQAAPDLTNIGAASFINNAKLSFGVSRNDIGYVNVGTTAGNSAVDINQNYVVSGSRLGVTAASSISGILNDSVVAGSSYPADSFGEADKGTLTLSFNGSTIDTINLASSSGALVGSNSRLSVTALSAVTTTSGQAFSFKKYRKGTFTIPSSLFVNGFNYLRITHNRGTSTVNTTYLEFVYDSENSALAFASTPTLTNPTLTGSKYISGVRYHTSGTIQLNAVISNVYKNVYTNSANAFSYPSLQNIGEPTVIVKSGTGVNGENNASKNLPALNPAAGNPQATNLTLASTHPITSSRLLGSTDSIGTVKSAFSIIHPIKATLTSSVISASGFLLDGVTQATNANNETFDGEIDRLQNRDYSSLTYTNINSGTYAWDGTQNLLTGDGNHNTGLLVFGGELMYPNTSYLTSTYGIAAGNFAPVTNGYAFNPNYSTASGVRIHNRKFKSANVTTQSTLTIDILHDLSTSFLTNGGTGGTITGNNIKVECLIKRSGGATHGYFNPFATTGNPEGIANTSIGSITGGTRVTCTLSTIPRVGNGDIVIFRVRANGWTGVISNVQITNI